jgi:hypothetical protein
MNGKQGLGEGESRFSLCIIEIGNFLILSNLDAVQDKKHDR